MPIQNQTPDREMEFEKLHYNIIVLIKTDESPV